MNTKQCVGCTYWNNYEKICDYHCRTGYQRLRPRNGDECLARTSTPVKARREGPCVKPLLSELGEMRVAGR